MKFGTFIVIVFVLLCSGFLMVTSISAVIDDSSGESDTKLALRREELLFKIIPEIAVTGMRREKEVFETSRFISVVTREELEKQTSLNVADVLQEETGVQVQKTTYGQASPFIRGLTGYHTLILIDGIRLNNSTFRSGPNQYMATLDTGQIERIEVVRGQGSVLYGSSAMGGVINAITRMPEEPLGRFYIHPHISTQFSSADRGKIARLGFDVGYDKLSFIVGGAYKDIGDLQPGKGYDIQLNNKKFLLTSEDNPDTPEGAWLVDKESPTSWKEADGDLKVNYRISDAQDVKVVCQTVRQRDVPRYDKLATREYDIYLFGPQNRDLIYGNYTAKGIVPFVDNLQTSVSYHRQEEGRRFQEAGGSSLKETNDVVNTVGLSIQLDSSLGKKQRLIYGGEFYHDTIASEQISTNLKTNEKKTSAWGRFPDGPKFRDINFYAQDELKVLDNLEMTLGGRYARFNTQADLSLKDPIFAKFESSDHAITGRWGLVYGITDNLNFVFNVGQAFRAPSLNDTTAVEVTNQGIDAPNPHLGPERSVGIDVGLKAKFQSFSGSIGYYHTKITGLIARVPVGKVYSESTMPKLYKDIRDAHPGIDVFVKDNVERSEIQGVELDLLGRIPYLPKLSAYGNLTFTHGDKPIPMEQPLNGLLGLRWHKGVNGLQIDFYSRFADKQDRLSVSDRRDSRIPGLTNNSNADDPRAYTPGWFTLNIKVAMKLGDQTRLIFGVKNITNRRYREHGSGVDGPGTNFVVSIGY